MGKTGKRKGRKMGKEREKVPIRAEIEGEKVPFRGGEWEKKQSKVEEKSARNYKILIDRRISAAPPKLLNPLPTPRRDFN